MNIVSHMLMGFVERKISPQTIADVLRAQIFESQIPINHLNRDTCCGILEAITHANSTKECCDLVLYLSTHPSFPQELSFKAAVGALCVLLRYGQNKVQEYKKFTELSNPKSNCNDSYEQDFFSLDIFNDSYKEASHFLKNAKKIDTLIEDLSLYILDIFQTKPHLVYSDVKENLIQFIKNTNPDFTKILQQCVHFQHLRFTILTKTKDSFGGEVTGVLPRPVDMISLLLKTSDEHLLRNGIAYYKTEPLEKNSSGRIKYLKSIIESLQTISFSDVKNAFFMEWVFENALNEAIENENITYEFVNAIKYVMENFGTQCSYVKGLLKAIQNSYSSLGNFNKSSSLEKANHLLSSIFLNLVTLGEKDLNYVSKNIANWALELPIPNEQYRFFQKNHWRWIRSLSAKIWDASLREPPSWVVEAGSVYCASIFHAAPALWLQEYAVSLIERVYHEIQVERFQPTNEHFNYVEYLLRCIRKKSPFFASRTESLVALHFLSRLTQTEISHFANAKSRFQSLLPSYSASQIQNSPEFLLWKKLLENEEEFKQSLGNNPVTQALAILMKLSEETARKCNKDILQNVNSP